ncbi:TonB family protein [Marinicella sp. W31]|uniref:TonB family protein n=1 Tax=Marinicella sp. W31 TaxID=3023713 RepID=UPI003757E0F8
MTTHKYSNVLFWCFLLFGFASLHNAYADILDADKAYSEKRYEDAFNEFESLAKLGNNVARYNLAIMLMKGQGTRQDLTQAYAWAALVDYEDNTEWFDLTTLLEAELSPEELKTAQSLAQRVENTYDDDQIFTQLAPVKFVPNDNNPSDSSEYQVTITSRKAPRYPKQAIGTGAQGWVRVEFEVHPDGSARNPSVLESIPSGTFDTVTLEAIKQFRFELNFKEGIEPYPVLATQLIQYTLNPKGNESLANLYQKRLSKLKSQAEKGHPTAQYYYALAASSQSVVSQYVDMEPEVMNDWLLKSAQNGHLDAQYQLGYNILTGKGCQVEKQKGIDWIVHAAQFGHAKSARQVYRQLTQYNHLNNTNNPPEYWLKQSADNGDPDSQLDYAYFLAHDGGAVTSVAEIRAYLDQHLKNREKSVKWYQTSAQAYLLENDKKKADKAMKKAHKLAKKMGWTI